MTRTTRIIMGMPITLVSPGEDSGVGEVFDTAFRFFERIDQLYSPYLATSDVSRINRGELTADDYSEELREMVKLADKTKLETNGYFDVWHNNTFDPSGIVKGWAIGKADELIGKQLADFYIDAGGDIQARGKNDKHQPWQIGVRNPFNRSEHIAIVSLDNYAIATSGTAIRGQHIYNPHDDTPARDIISLSVIAPNIIDADRMATAAFAMGKNGVEFIETLEGYEGYQVDTAQRATMTTGWHSFEVATA